MGKENTTATKVLMWIAITAIPLFISLNVYIVNKLNDHERALAVLAEGQLKVLAQEIAQQKETLAQLVRELHEHTQKTHTGSALETPDYGRQSQGFRQGYQ
jgi:hypothetical protein